MDDMISRQAAIDALWKALYEYEDKTEKQFQESDELDVGDWILHRVFVQNMSDIDRQTILELPSAQPKAIRPKFVAEDRYRKDLFQIFPRCPKCNYELEAGDCYCRVCGCHIDWSEDDE